MFQTGFLAACFLLVVFYLISNWKLSWKWKAFKFDAENKQESQKTFMPHLPSSFIAASSGDFFNQTCGLISEIIRMKTANGIQLQWRRHQKTNLALICLHLMKQAGCFLTNNFWKNFPNYWRNCRFRKLAGKLRIITEISHKIKLF